MRVTQQDIQRTSRTMLADVMRLDGSTWRPEELRDILQHQLAAPLVFDFSGEGAPTSTAPSGLPNIRSFAHLFAHTDPPLLLLELTKDFAKRFGQPHGLLPEEVGKVLYYAAICCALLRHDRSITSLDNTAVRAGAEWALRQEWLHASLHDLFSEAMRAFKGR